MPLPVAILAGGLATRLGPLVEHTPKSLLEVDGRPFAEHQIRLLREHGLTDVVFLAGHLGRMLEAALGDGSRWDVRVRYAYDGARPLGTGGAVKAAAPMLGDEFFVMYGDSYLECDYAAIERAFRRGGQPGLMTVFHNADVGDRSNVSFAEGRILRYDKQARTPDMQHIDYGLGAFRAGAFAAYRPDEAFDLTLVYQDLLSRQELDAYEVDTRFHEIGSPAGLEDTRAHLARRRSTVA